ncbi:MAG: ABC transporter substrate-binding protein [Solirubrobacteraceae bacterium MAG38_C4-C5]|nr:ABC transporter substrate-binding protein [Candidatus Siliceabacter maunaloa]
MSPPTNHIPSSDDRLSRRSFMARAGATGVAVAVPSWLAAACGPASGPISEAGAVRMTHGTGLCNLGIFIVNERKLAEPGLEVTFVNAPSNADIATLFGAGQVEASVVPYSQFVTLRAEGAPVKIVAGAGVEGCAITAARGIGSAEDLRGKTLGTFQADTLEMLPYDYLKQAGVAFNDVDVRYFSTSPELAQAFLGGQLDAVSHIEPYATQTLQREGTTVLTDGIDLYGRGYSDCVLAARESFMAERRDDVKRLIKAMLKAQRQCEADLEAAAREATGKYFKTDVATTLDAATKQKVKIDQRDQRELILNSAQNLQELNYIQSPPGDEMFDFSLFEEVIDENRGLYDALELT